MRQRWWMSNDRRDEGGEARNHEAEVEAVAVAIQEAARLRGLRIHVGMSNAMAEAALDAVRRSQADPASPGYDERMERLMGRSPQGEDHE